jgi:hypothetical protein
MDTTARKRVVERWREEVAWRSVAAWWSYGHGRLGLDGARGRKRREQRFVVVDGEMEQRSGYSAFILWRLGLGLPVTYSGWRRSSVGVPRTHGVNRAAHVYGIEALGALFQAAATVSREKGVERPMVPRQGRPPAGPLGGFKAEAQVVEASMPTWEGANWAVVVIWADEGRPVGLAKKEAKRCRLTLGRPVRCGSKPS